jgi:hypothetical protein
VRGQVEYLVIRTYADGRLSLKYPRRMIMKTTAANTGMDPALKAEMQEACDRIAKGILPTMDERKAAATKIDRMREENAKVFGVQDVTLDAVRASRSQ